MILTDIPLSVQDALKADLISITQDIALDGTVFVITGDQPAVNEAADAFLDLYKDQHDWARVDSETRTQWGQGSQPVMDGLAKVVLGFWPKSERHTEAQTWDRLHAVQRA